MDIIKILFFIGLLSFNNLSHIDVHLNYNKFILRVNKYTNDTIIDSKLTFDESIKGINIPDPIKKTLCIIDIIYYGFDSKIHKGQIVISKELEKEVVEIFQTLFKNKFPIQKIVPIVNYKWSDSLSMANNNTSCFNYRTVKGSKKLSDHSYGRAIDINPIQNPYINYRTKKRIPINAKYINTEKGTILRNSFIVKAFKNKGWKWGGDWKYTKDYQHFYKK